MKAELVNLVTPGSTETVVLLATDLNELTPTERIQTLELTIWLIDEGWTVTTTTDSPLAPVVRKGAEAMHGTYRPIDGSRASHVESSRCKLPPIFGGRSIAH
ncbi:hypothetical protein GCM10027568_09640 [Humibacter soli]